MYEYQLETSWNVLTQYQFWSFAKFYQCIAVSIKFLKQYWTLHAFLSAIQEQKFFLYCLDTKDADSKLLRKVGKYLLIEKESYPRGTELSAPLCEHQI
jgi:hypothetical protein